MAPPNTRVAHAGHCDREECRGEVLSILLLGTVIETSTEERYCLLLLTRLACCIVQHNFRITVVPGSSRGHGQIEWQSLFLCLYEIDTGIWKQYGIMIT